MLVKSLQSNWEDFNVILFGDSENRNFPGDYIDAINERYEVVDYFTQNAKVLQHFQYQ